MTQNSITKVKQKLIVKICNGLEVEYHFLMYSKVHEV